MPVRLRGIVAALLLFAATASLAACLPPDPGEVHRLKEVEKTVRAMPGVTGARGSATNGLDAGKQSTFIMGVASTATPEQIASAIAAAHEGLTETPAADKYFNICIMDKWKASTCDGYPESRPARIRYEPVVDNDEMVATLETVQRVYAATEERFEVRLNASPEITFHRASPDHDAIAALATTAGSAAGDAEVAVRVEHHGGRYGHDTAIIFDAGSLAPRAVQWWRPLGRIVEEYDTDAWLTVQVGATTTRVKVYIEDGSTSDLAADLAQRCELLAMAEETVTVVVTKGRESVEFEIAGGAATERR